MHPSEGYITTEDGVRLFYQKLGSGPHAVIIPNAIHMFDSFQGLAANRTLIFFDLRNRGASDSVTDGEKLKRGIHNDVDDIEAVRRHFGIEKVDLIGHSNLGLTVILYAMKYPAHARRVIQIGASQPHAATQYPPHLTGADATLADFLSKLSQPRSQNEDPKEGCRKLWPMIRVLMVADPADADKIHWTPCDSLNEVHFMKYWMQHVFPSIQALALTPEEMSKVNMPVLTIHGTRDRQAPYGGGREWAVLLPDARLLTVENAAHVPWIEAPEKVFGAIQNFLDGAWPDAAEQVESVDPVSKSAKQQ